ncbi:hypothetical protein [Skermania piniformis]|nr:hypothetical protein [Skermania piniformis]
MTGASGPSGGHGLLFRTGASTSHVTIHVVDPETGKSAIHQKFDADDADVQLAPATSGGRDTTRHDVSPDGSLIVATKTVRGETHAGWVDRSGKFTDVTAAVSGTNDFRPPAKHEPFGFDRAGNYYYTDRAAETGYPPILRVAIERPDAATDTGSTYNASGFRGDYVWTANGELWTKDRGPLPSGYTYCTLSNRVYWIDDHRFVAGDGLGSNLYVGELSAIRDEGSSCTNGATKLLPEGAALRLGDAVANPAGDSIAFYADTRDFSGIYRVPVSGGAPVRTVLTGDVIEDFGESIITGTGIHSDVERTYYYDIVGWI